MDTQAEQKMKLITIDAVVIRADGSREDFGTVSYWHRNPLKRWMFALKQKLARS